MTKKAEQGNLRPKIEETIDIGDINISKVGGYLPESMQGLEHIEIKDVLNTPIELINYAFYTFNLKDKDDKNKPLIGDDGNIVKRHGVTLHVKVNDEERTITTRSRQIVTRIESLDKKIGEYFVIRKNRLLELGLPITDEQEIEELEDIKQFVISKTQSFKIEEQITPNKNKTYIIR